jgi:beta-lactamase regulating signal transducer with metallopeptidase domain
VIGALFTLAAAALERSARAVGKPTRMAWAAAIVVTAVWPCLALVGSWRPFRSALYGNAPTSPLTLSVQRAIHIFATTPSPVGLTRAVDVSLLAAWAIASVILLVRVVLAVRLLAGERTAWRAQRVDGVEVSISRELGPAIVGLRSMQVVMPEWTLALDESLRAMVLRHESEHANARDPLVLFASALIIALMPWNLALWLQARRLRLAIEMDCDARVLRAFPTPERYGMLLLTIAQRRGRSSSRLAPSLSEPVSHLERRIIVMRSAHPRFPSVRALTFALIAACAVAAACALQGPERVTAPQATPSLSVAQTPVDPSRTYFEFQVEQPVTLQRGGFKVPK